MNHIIDSRRPRPLPTNFPFYSIIATTLVFFKYFSRQISFSRTYQDSPAYSSTFQACANPVVKGWYKDCIKVMAHHYQTALIITIMSEDDTISEGENSAEEEADNIYCEWP